MLLELDGRLEETLPERPLAPVEGRLLTVGRLLVVGLLTLPLALVRPELLPSTRPELTLAVGRLDMLPPPLMPWRPSLGKR